MQLREIALTKKRLERKLVLLFLRVCYGIVCLFLSDCEQYTRLKTFSNQEKKVLVMQLMMKSRLADAVQSHHMRFKCKLISTQYPIFQ